MHEAILAEVVQEEAEAAEAEITGKAGTLDMPRHLRIDRTGRAAAPAVRRVTRKVVSPAPRWSRACSGGPYPSAARRAHPAAEVEDIARRVTREELRRR